MKTFINSFNAGEISGTFNESQLSGDLKALQYISVHKLQNAIPNGNEGIKQRNGHKLSSIINTNDKFETFPLILSRVEAQILIFKDKIIILLPDFVKYFITILDQTQLFDITTIQDVYTDSKSQLFIASSRGIDVFTITDNFQSATTGSSVLMKEEIKGLDSATIKSITTNAYLYCEGTQGDKYLNKIIYFLYYIKIYDPDEEFEDVIDAQFPFSIFSSTSGIYLEIKPGINIGDIVSVNLKLPYRDEDFTINCKITKQIRGYYFITNGKAKIYPYNNLPDPLIDKTFYKRYNIPESDLRIINLFQLDFDLHTIYKSIIHDTLSITESDYIRGYREQTAHPIFQENFIIDTIESISIEYANKIVLTTQVQGLSGEGFCMYLNTDNRLYIAYDNIAKASEVNNLTNFVLPSPETGKIIGDELSNISPLNLGLKGISQIKWITKLRDRGTLYGTDTGLKLLNYGATSFRSGISDISDMIPSRIRPINITINGIGGTAFVNSTNDKVMFLSSQSTLETPIEDLTKYINFFNNDKIKKIISVPYLAGEMTMVLTENNKVYRLTTGNNDKFGWSRDNFDVINEYFNKDQFPLVGKSKEWYLDLKNNLYYKFIDNKYNNIEFSPTKVYDISTYQNQLIIIFLIDNIPNVQPVKVISVLRLDIETTADLYDSVPLIEYNFTIPRYVFINANQPDLPVYFPDQVDDSFKKAIVQPSQFLVETHYHEYVSARGNTKTLNRYIQDLIINCKKVYDLEVGYKISVQDNKEIEKVQQYVARTFKRIDDNLNPVVLEGNLKVPNSYQGEKISIVLKNSSVLPVTIYSLAYNTNF